MSHDSDKTASDKPGAIQGESYVNSDAIENVLQFIEENIRVSDQTEIEYLDPHNHIKRLGAKQNQIIFGRRGSGKSLLLKSMRIKLDEKACIKIDLEDHKDVSFPDSIIQILVSILDQCVDLASQKYPWYKLAYWRKSRTVIKNLRDTKRLLKSQLELPDSYNQEEKEKSGDKISGRGKGTSKHGELEAVAEKTTEVERTRKVKFDKLDKLRKQLPELKKKISDVSAVLEKDIFLILDDFYFIKKEAQPHLLDYLHRMSKDTPLYLKVATIKHRSKLYTQNGSYVGMELGHDAQTLNLDYSLDNFNDLVKFMKDLLNHISEKTNTKIDFDKLMSDKAFRFLCLASGGVPRDFFTLFIALGSKLRASQLISKPSVIEMAINNFSAKLDSLKTDSADEEPLLIHHLDCIKKEIVTARKWNSFLVSNSGIQDFPQIGQAIKELVDLRFLHLVNSNLSATHSDGTRYSAYMVDIGLFPNSNPREFQQVEPGQKDDQHRDDRIRSAPKYSLKKHAEYIENLGLENTLDVVEQEDNMQLKSLP